MWPSNSAEKNTYLIEIMLISKLSKDTTIKVRFHIKDTLTPIFDFNINAIIR